MYNGNFCFEKLENEQTGGRDFTIFMTNLSHGSFDRMVFCVIYVFGTLLEFTLLIFLQKQVFAPKFNRPGMGGTTSFTGPSLWRRSTMRLSQRFDL